MDDTAYLLRAPDGGRGLNFWKTN